MSHDHGIFCWCKWQLSITWLQLSLQIYSRNLAAFNHSIQCLIVHLLKLWLVLRSTLKLLDTIQNLCYLIKLWQQILIMSSLKTFLVFIVWTIITGILMATCSCGISTMDWSILTISWGKYHVTISILYVVPSYQSDYFFLQCLWTQQDLY